ncbi:MAG: efflux RND transporter periplasmic adaptor subunit, partial [Alphaproteobacteria bacterium]|nr:efflux RND transporter periplasmic adaptor subunit [Alphaproteobacteria bacterium]
MNDEPKKTTSRLPMIAVGAALAATAIGAGGFWLGAQQRGAPTAAQGEDERRVLYWYDPMVPDQHFDAPGRSPFMAMDLVPR